MAQEQPLFTGYLKPMYGSCRTLLTDSSRSKTSAIHFYLRLLLQISAPGVCTEVSRLYIEALDKGELYDSAADDERLCAVSDDGL